MTSSEGKGLSRSRTRCGADAPHMCAAQHAASSDVPVKGPAKGPVLAWQLLAEHTQLGFERFV